MGVALIIKYNPIFQCNEKFQLQIIPTAKGRSSRKKGMFFQMGIMG